jgi:DNA-binding CsgD family transcriptional regulator
VETIASFIPYLGIPFLIAAWYMFIKLAAEMTGKSVSGAFTFAYFAFMLIVLLGYGYLIVYLFKTQSETAQFASDLVKYVFVGLEGLTLLVAFYFLYRRGSGIKHRSFRIAVLRFANICLGISIVRIALFFPAETNMVFAAAYILVYFAGDIPAILYLGGYLNKHYLINARPTQHLTPFADFISNYRISKREWEIIEKIGEGMTNRQISEVLFISLQTVKDHTHRIYKKTGVKNRVHLVKMISEIREGKMVSPS